LSSKDIARKQITGFVIESTCIATRDILHGEEEVLVNYGPC